MATDILGIAFKADTSDLKKGANELDKIAASGTKAGRAAKKLKDDFKKTGKEAETTNKKVNGLSKGFRSAATNAAAFEGPLGGVSGRLGAMSTLLASTNPLMVGFGLAVSAATVFMVGAVKEHDKLNLLNKKTEAILRATGHAAGFAAHELDGMAKSLALNTLASVEGVKAAQNVLLTFKGITEDSFRETLTLAQDMSSVLGTDIKGAALQLGKALNEPEAGLTMLQRAGVTFDPVAKKTVKNLIAIGKAEAARAIMFKELQGQFSGTGEAEALNTLSGAVDTLGQNWQTLMVNIASSGASSGVISLIELMAEAAEGWNNILFTEDNVKLSELHTEMLVLQSDLKALQGGDRATVLSMIVGTESEALNVERKLKAVRSEISEIQDKKVKFQKAESSASNASIAILKEKEAARLREIEDAKALKKASAQTDIPKQNLSSFRLADFLQEQADEEVKINKEKNDKKIRDDKAAHDQKKAMEQLTLSTTADLFGNLASIAAAGGEESFTMYKRMAQAQAGVSAGLAILNALAAPTGNPILNGAMAVSIGALAGVQIAQIEQQQYTGARAMGGQVSGGQSYVVGEQGREIITMGSQGGFVTPNHKMGGGESVTVVNQIGNGVQGNTRAEVMAMLPSIIAATSKAARSSRR